jgi:hypothetical protein
MNQPTITSPSQLPQQNAMTTDVFRRVVWKEYRMLRSFWIALVAIVVGAQAIAWFSGTATGALQADLVIMVTAIVAYALGIGATIFAVEREEGTDTFLQPLPVESRQLFTAKVALASASVVALAGALALVTFAWKWLGLVRMPLVTTNEGADVLWARAVGVVFGTIDAFLWGLFFSLLLRRPLVAACVGAAAAIAVLPGIFLFVAILRSLPHAYYVDQTTATAIGFTILLAAVFAVDWWLGRHWLEGHAVQGILRRRQQRLNAAQRVAAFDTATPYLSPMTSFRRLTWQEFRQARRLMIIFVGIGAILAFLIAVEGSIGGNWAGRATAVMPPTIGIVALMGSCVFLADQERSQFRYFAERPVSARMVWLNRQCVWLGVVIAVLAVGVPLWVHAISGTLAPLTSPVSVRNLAGLPTGPAQFSGCIDQLPSWAFFAMCAALAYSCGQLCSMVFRSGIVAGFAGIVLSLAVSVWIETTVELRLNWLVTVAPIPMFLLWTTWWRAPHWIGERTGWWSWARLGLSLVMPAMAIVVATATYRVFQIPWAEPGFSPVQYAAQVTPEARQTADMYLRAIDLLRATGSPIPLTNLPSGRTRSSRPIGTYTGLGWETTVSEGQLEWLAQNQEPLKLILDATTRPTCVLPTRSLVPTGSVESFWMLYYLLATDARRLVDEGDLDSALDRLLAMLRMSVHMREHHYAIQSGARCEQEILRALREWWNTRDGQTSERLRNALPKLETWQRTVPAITDPIQARYISTEKLLALDPNTLADASLQYPHFESTKDELISLSLAMPWEFARARRGLNYVTSVDMNRANSVLTAIAQHAPTSQLLLWGTPPAYDNALRTTPWLTPLLEMPAQGQSQSWVECLAQYQATRICLALSAWRIEHGELPDSLQELVGEYFDVLPVDPYSGKDFVYFPIGVTQGVSVNHPAATVIPDDAPFLWGRGPDLIDRKANIYAGEQIHTHFGRPVGPPEATPETRQLGWAIPIEVLQTREPTSEEPAPQQTPDAETEPNAAPQLPAADPFDAPQQGGGLSKPPQPESDATPEEPGPPPGLPGPMPDATPVDAAPIDP